MTRGYAIAVSAAALLGGELAMGLAAGDTGRLAPGLVVGSVPVGGLTPAEALTAGTMAGPTFHPVTGRQVRAM